jgi:adenylosuccinate synthase
VVIGAEEYKLHLVPSGIFYPGKKCLIGNGVVLDPGVLLGELRALTARGIDVSGLSVSLGAHVILPYHKKLDEYEEAAKGEQKIGTTGRGIGPAYRDKVSRQGIRVLDLLDKEEFERKLQDNLREKNELITKIYGQPPLDFASIFAEFAAYGEELRPYAGDTPLQLYSYLQKGEKVLFEGAQGIMLDLDHGTYPFVTSSHPVAGGACTGAGVGPTVIDDVVGVAKAYTTRVGEGPFPTELIGEAGDQLRNAGQEFGTTTGRPRRCGWFDAMVVRYAARITGLTHLALTKLDVLSGLATLRICVGYSLDGEVIQDFPQGLKALKKCVPIYEELPGWQTDITGARSFAELPQEAQTYVSRLEELTGVPITILAVGPGRDQTIKRGTIWR